MQKIDDSRIARSIQPVAGTAVFSIGEGDEVYYHLNGKAVFPGSSLLVMEHIRRLHLAGVRLDAAGNPWVEQAIKRVTDELVAVRPHDAVDAPNHYRLPGLPVEWMDVRKALTSTIPMEIPHEIAGDWRESITYLARMWQKNGLEDAKKARVYLDKMIAEMEALHGQGTRI